MGEALYAQLSEDHPDIACRTYAPVGSHRDLLAYLVRRLLENGANSSFVALAADEAIPVSTLLRRPADIIGSAAKAAHPNIPSAARSLFAATDEFARAGIRRARGVGPARCRCCRGDHAHGRQYRRCDAGRGECGDIGRARRIQELEPNAGRDARARAGKSRRPAGATRSAFHRAAATRGRQDAGRRAVGGPRGRRFLPLLCRARPRTVRRRQGDAGPDRREQCARLARPRRLRRDLAVEFSAGDLHGPGRGGADGRQCRHRKTRRADAADRGGSRAVVA